MSKPRIVIVEDKPGLRAALAAACAAGSLHVVGSFERGADALAALSLARPDVALVDLELPDMSGIDVIGAMHAEAPELAILVHTVFEDPQTILDAIRAGARGYLVKGGGSADVVRALHEVHQGLAPISAVVARHVLDAVRESRSPLADPLTAREHEVLGLLVQGAGYARVATSLGITTGTVQTHVKAVYRKLGVSSKTEAALVARRRGVVRDG